MSVDVGGSSDGFTLSGAAEDDYLGQSVSGAGDINVDGGTDASAAYVIYGQPKG